MIVEVDKKGMGTLHDAYMHHLIECNPTHISIDQKSQIFQISMDLNMLSDQWNYVQLHDTTLLNSLWSFCSVVTLRAYKIMAHNDTVENYPENLSQLWLSCKISINKRKMWMNYNNLLLPPLTSTAKNDRIKHTTKQNKNYSKLKRNYE